MSQQTSSDAITERTRRPNRLAQETSPYLLQHAYNPVDWFPWSPEALQQARELNRPILLSIGYSSCHWCHVMERESFENEQIAGLMNQDFVCIKVDREERPDLDEIYMQATLAMNQGQGGWPMTVFLTPEQEPIFAGTYFPPTDRWGRPGFATVLRKVADLWQKDAGSLRRQATHLTEQLKQAMRTVSAMAVGEAEMEAAVTQFAETFDARHGGFGSAPKFPPATGLSFLLRRYHKSKDSQALTMVRRTLDAMAAGGIYDQIGGGFARYSTDDRWLVPHFEKMLYDNALLARVYAEGYNLTGEATYRRIAAETLDYILREMTAPEGGFYSATDADSEGVEGKFFVWTPDDVRAALQAARPKPDASAAAEDSRRICAYYDIIPTGNWHEPVAQEGDHGPRSIPHVPRSLDDVASELGIHPDELRRTIERTRPVLYEARRQRVPPGLDDKILTSWNGMMISAMAEASRVLGEGRYRRAAEAAADFLLKTMRKPDGGLLRTYRAGKAHLAACLDDYAYLAEGLIDLYEAGAHERYLREAVRLAERIVSDFSDEEQGGFFTTAKDHEQLIVRTKEGPDGAIPSGNAVAASVLARLASHYGREDFREAAVRAIRAYGSQISRYPRAFAKSLSVLDLLLEGPVELALIGSPEDSGYQALRSRMDQHYLPNRIIAHHDPSQPSDPLNHPLLTGRELARGQAALYVCRNFTCQRPITDPAEVAAALAAVPGQSGTERPGPRSGAKVLAAKRLAGQATAGGTAQYAVRFVNRPSVGFSGQAYVRLGTTGLTTSRLGFGGYRVTIDEEEHRQALTKALTEGCNLIDTSTNYTDGDSERLIGAVLSELVKGRAVARDEVILVSKIGYVQGHNLKAAEAREQAGNPYPEIVKYGDGIWHCIHPEFLADQLALSLDRLGLETLDVCLLHNPEYFFSDAKHRGRTDLSPLREEFYERIAAAFAYFETQVAEGRLLCYGISSNTCTSAPDDPEATSLSRFLEAAQRAAAQVGARDHHFKVLQCPMNLFEAGALLTPNTGPKEQQTVLDLAQAAGIAVLVNRPLNAIPKARDGHASPMIRLADAVLEPPGPSYEALQEKVAALEQEYRREFAPHVQTSGQGMPPEDYFRWADELTRVRPLVVNLEHWDQIENQMVAPHLNQVLRALGQHLTTERVGELSERWQAWRDRYLPELLALLRAVRREATLKSREKTATLSRVIDPLLPESRRKEPLSRKALWALISTPGVTCVLNGMRTEAYIENSLEILRWDLLPDPRRVYEAIQALAAI